MATTAERKYIGKPVQKAETNLREPVAADH